MNVYPISYVTKNQYFLLKNKQFSVDIFPIFTVFIYCLSLNKIMFHEIFALCLMFSNKFSIYKKYFFIDSGIM